MINIKFNLEDRNSPTILCLGAHSDDIEIGAGATILGLAETSPNANIVWVVFSGIGERRAEAEDSAKQITKGFQRAEVVIHEYRDGYFPYNGVGIKECFEKLKRHCQPDLIFTHYHKDLHQDHLLISDITRQTFRDHMILEYEIPKYDGDLGAPNVFFPVSRKYRDEKQSVLEQHFGTQRNRAWFNEDTFDSLMSLRGIECNSHSGFAEAFYCRKFVLR